MNNIRTSQETAKGNWEQQRVKLKAKFNTLKDSDLTFEVGKKEEMMDQLQVKLGKTKDELKAIIETL
jgi:uncharacterized protein YjbJ (UPF0337 family)